MSTPTVTPVGWGASGDASLVNRLSYGKDYSIRINVTGFEVTPQASFYLRRVADEVEIVLRLTRGTSRMELNLGKSAAFNPESVVLQASRVDGGRVQLTLDTGVGMKPYTQLAQSDVERFFGT